MVVALFALALAMIAGGLTAVVQGYEIVLLERGWTLVISGSVFASGGALLLGLAMAVARLGKIQAQLVKNGERAGHAEHVVPTAPALEPMAAASAGLLAGGADGGPAETPGDDDRDQPTLPLFMRRDPQDQEIPEDESRAVPPEAAPERVEPPEPVEPPAAARNDNHGPRLSLPRYFFGRRDPEPEADIPDSRLAPPDLSPEPSSRRDAGSDAVPDDDGDAPAAGGRPEIGDGSVPASAHDEPDGAVGSPLRPSGDELESVPASEDRATETPPDAAARATIIGSYNSGDNRYVMFSDGSIEADTPDGVFRFASLDELKEFIASGGEGGARKAT